LTSSDFKRAMSEAGSVLERIRMPVPAASRIRRELDRPRRRSRRMGLWLVGLAAAGAGAVLIARHQAPLTSEYRARPERIGGLPETFEAISHSTDLQLSVDAPRATLRVERGSCTLRVRDWGRVSLRAGSSLGQTEGGLEFRRGAADFQVDKRAPGTGSTFVRGPQGTIEITGTRFSVIQGASGGSVHLDEGAIRFHSPDGRTVALAPGESLTWPLPPLDDPALPSPLSPPRSAAAAIAPAAPGASSPAEDSRIVERIAALRAEGRYRKLVEELGLALEREQRPLTRERLSFELGSVLTYHLEGGARACAHWAAHERAFPGGHYAQEVSDARTVLHCGREGGSR
jgi:transmembrane sensor